MVLEDHRIAFRTTAVGTPHLVKVSYFPNWRARGAEGPWRATPSLMVVIPTEEEVEITFERTWAEWAGGGLTLAGLAAVAAWFARRGYRALVRRRAESAAAGISEAEEPGPNRLNDGGRVASERASQTPQSPQDAERTSGGP